MLQNQRNGKNKNRDRFTYQDRYEQKRELLQQRGASPSTPWEVQWRPVTAKIRAKKMKCPFCETGVLREYIGIERVRIQKPLELPNLADSPYTPYIPLFEPSIVRDVVTGIRYTCSICGNTPIEYEMDAKTATKYPNTERFFKGFFEAA